MYNVKSILDFMDKAVKMVESASPLATALGIPFVEQIAKIADTAINVGQNAIARKDDVNVILTSKDETEINAHIVKLDAINAELNAKILAS